MNRGDLLASVCQYQDVRSARVSSWDHTGRNRDYFVVMPGETATLADIEGPGAITHIWATQSCKVLQGPNLAPLESSVPGVVGQTGTMANDPDYYRKVVIRMYWDEESEPSVLAPFGDFFCIGNSITGNFQSLPFTVSAWPAQRNKYGGDAAVNCYLRMPFNRHARIEIENQGSEPLTQYFYVDYELYRQSLPRDTLYFHAHWKRENPTKGWAPLSMQVNSAEVDVPNLDGKNNYVILDTQGSGNYIGCNHSVTKFQPGWWGEGDDMIFIDGEQWPPSMHGTGSEDYFSQAWEMQPGNTYNFNGSIIHEQDVPDNQVSYRFHLADPIRFAKSIRVTMEHGHGNHLSNDWATTAYWYQTLPGPKLSIPPVEDRLPVRQSLPAHSATADPSKDDMIKQAEQRFAKTKKDRDENLARLSKQSAQWARQNTQNARLVRERWEKSQ